MERFFKKPEAVADLRCGPLGCYIDAFATSLHDDGYAVSTGRFQLQVFSDFSRWLQVNNVLAEHVTREHSSRYMQYRDKTGFGNRAGAEAAMNRILRFLEALNVTPVARSIPLRARDRVVDEFAAYLFEQRGLAERTVALYRRMALLFLEFLAESDHFDPSAVTAPNVYRFVQQQASADRKSRGKNMLKAIRSFLRFAHFRGYVATDLADTVPRIANWALASIPKSVSPAQVEKILSTCDRTTQNGKRDFAILLLLARLGLRVGEVASLTLDDINWDSGTLVVRGKTGLRTLPLPNDVGEATARYLSEVRPKTKSRVVFFRLLAPIREMTSQESFCGIVRRAMQQARIKSNGRGAHQFRHGLATELLRKGASIPDIGEILGHRKLESTMIYAKVDLISLRKIARRWPGGV